MSNLTAFLLIAALLTGLTTSCNERAVLPQETSTATDEPNSDSMKPVEATAAPDQSDSTPKVENEPQPVPDKKTYHMNHAYFIKPNDENDNKKIVLLTFDDGPKEKVLLTSILDTLDTHSAKAIFFVNGFRVKQHPELLKLIVERGQFIGNHSWDHINLKKETEEEIDRQMADVQTIVKETTGQSPQFFRPPNGAGNDYIRAKAAELGMLYMTWSNGSLDWSDNKNDPAGIVNSVMEQLLPGSNILMHEHTWTAEALDTLLTEIENAGYSFVHPDAIELVAR